MAVSLILGFFDGVHKAHRAVISSALDFANGNKVVLLTFKEAPSLFFGRNFNYVMQREDSMRIIHELGVNEIVSYDFNQLAAMPAEKFLNMIVEKYRPDGIFTGFNYTYGQNKSGNSQTLKQEQEKYGYKYFCTEPVIDNGDVVSSSLIRELIRGGKLERANHLLESDFSIYGKVIHGAELGRTIGFPTANLNYPENIVKLPFGVYSTKVYIENKKYKSITNWGIKPTVNKNGEPILETHICGFNGDLYGKSLRVEFLKMIRKEQKFEDIKELKIQIEKDIKECLKL